MINDILNLGGWPMIHKFWDQQTFSWNQTLIKLRAKGFNHNLLVSIYIGSDIKNNNRHTIMVNDFNFKWSHS